MELYEFRNQQAKATQARLGDAGKVNGPPSHSFQQVPHLGGRVGPCALAEVFPT